MRSLGINPANGREIFIDRYGRVTDLWSASQWSIIGDEQPIGQGSFGVNLRWKNLWLSTTFMYEFGGDRYNYTLVKYVENAKIPYDNVDRRVLEERWTKPGDISHYKDISNKTVTGATSRFVQKYNILELSSISLTYDLKPEWIKKLGMSGCRVGVTLNDLFWTSSVRREMGLEYPFSRSVNFTLNLSF
jgi:hypothetical protein